MDVIAGLGSDQCRGTWQKSSRCCLNDRSFGNSNRVQHPSCTEEIEAPRGAGAQRRQRGTQPPPQPGVSRFHGGAQSPCSTLYTVLVAFLSQMSHYSRQFCLPNYADFDIHVAYLMFYFWQDFHQRLQCLVVGPQLHSTDTHVHWKGMGTGRRACLVLCRQHLKSHSSFLRITLSIRRATPRHEITFKNTPITAKPFSPITASL